MGEVKGTEASTNGRNRLGKLTLRKHKHNTRMARSDSLAQAGALRKGWTNEYVEVSFLIWSNEDANFMPCFMITRGDGISICIITGWSKDYIKANAPTPIFEALCPAQP